MIQASRYYKMYWNWIIFNSLNEYLLDRGLGLVAKGTDCFMCVFVGVANATDEWKKEVHYQRTTKLSNQFASPVSSFKPNDKVMYSFILPTEWMVSRNVHCLLSWSLGDNNDDQWNTHRIHFIGGIVRGKGRKSTNTTMAWYWTGTCHMLISLLLDEAMNCLCWRTML